MRETCEYHVQQDSRDSTRWVITFRSRPESMIESMIVVEVFDEERGPIACVLQRKNCSRSAMIRIMNRLMTMLDDDDTISYQASEQQS